VPEIVEGIQKQLEKMQKIPNVPGKNAWAFVRQLASQISFQAVSQSGHATG